MDSNNHKEKLLNDNRGTKWLLKNVTPRIKQELAECIEKEEALWKGMHDSINTERDMDFGMSKSLKRESIEDRSQSENFRSKIVFENEDTISTMDKVKSHNVNRELYNNNNMDREFTRNVESENEMCQVQVKMERQDSENENYGECTFEEERYGIAIKMESLEDQDTVSFDSGYYNVYDLLLDCNGFEEEFQQEKTEENGVEESSVHYDDLVLLEEKECKFCERIFKNRLNLLKHNIGHMRLNVDIPRTAKKKPPKTAKTSKTTFNCSYCGKIFHKYKIWHEHTQIHRSGDFICELCRREFKCKRYLRTHLRIKHSFGKTRKILNLICDDCGGAFKHRENLVSHIRNCHTDNAHGCGTCGAVFKNKPYLRTHMKRVHFDYGTKFHCDCGKSFRTPKALYAHKRNKRLYRSKKIVVVD